MSRLVPKLRFKEFSGEWEEKKIGDVGNIVTGTTPSTKKDIYYNGGIYPWVTPTDITEKKNITETKKLLTHEGLKVGRHIPKNSLLVTCIASIGKNVILRKDGSCNQQINAIIPYEDFSVDFLYYLIENNNHILLANAGQGGMAMLNKNDFSNLTFLFPNLEEQQKIADAYSSLDALIEAQTKKVEALKKHKKALMQQLFPQEGEKTPKLRFKEFSGEWEEKKLGELCSILNNRRKPITSTDRTSGYYPYYGASGIVDYTNDYIFDERLLLVGEDGAKWKAFEESAFIAEGKYWVNNHAHVLKCHSVVDTYLKNYLVMLDILPYVTGFAPPKLTLENLKKIPIPIPPDKEKKEQQKIADTLSSLDALIEAQTKKVEALKKHKKGLMQQMFVSGEE